MKRCPKCSTIKDKIYFCKDKYTADGLKGMCRDCCAAAHKEWASKRDNGTLQRASKSKGNKYNVNLSREDALAVKKEKMALYRIENKKRIQEYGRERRRSEEHRQRKNARLKIRRQTDMAYRMECTLRGRVKNALKMQRVGKVFRTISALGCSIHDFKKWIEMNFLPDMSWENYGFGMDKWNLDHYIPCSAFSLEDPEQQRKCFHWSNQFPMWQKDNFAKNAQVPPPMSQDRLDKIAEFTCFLSGKDKPISLPIST